MQCLFSRTGSRERRCLHPTKILWHHSTCHVCKNFRIQFKHSAGITILDQKILFGKLFEKIKQESFPKKIFFLSLIEKLFIHLSRFWFLQQGLKGNQVKILNSPAAVSFTESFKHHIATVFQREGA